MDDGCCADGTGSLACRSGHSSLVVVTVTIGERALCFNGKQMLPSFDVTDAGGWLAVAFGSAATFRLFHREVLCWRKSKVTCVSPFVCCWVPLLTWLAPLSLIHI